MEAIDRIIQEAESLTESERLALAHRLLSVGEREPTAEIDRAWDLEIRDRIARYDRGEAATRPAGEVFADLDNRLRAIHR